MLGPSPAGFQRWRWECADYDPQSQDSEHVRHQPFATCADTILALPFDTLPLYARNYMLQLS